MEIWELRCALTQPYESTFHAFTVAVRLWSPSEKVLTQFSLCIERSVYKCDCIMANQLIFYTEQRVFIYDQYLLTQSASQVWTLFETWFPGVKIPSCSTVHNLYNKFQATGRVEPKKQYKPRSVLTEETLDDIGHRLEQSPSKSRRCLSQQVGISGKFYKEVPKMYGQRRWQLQHLCQ